MEIFKNIVISIVFLALLYGCGERINSKLNFSILEIDPRTKLSNVLVKGSNVLQTVQSKGAFYLYITIQVENTSDKEASFDTNLIGIKPSYGEGTSLGIAEIVGIQVEMKVGPKETEKQKLVFLIQDKAKSAKLIIPGHDSIPINW